MTARSGAISDSSAEANNAILSDRSFPLLSAIRQLSHRDPSQLSIIALPEADRMGRGVRSCLVAQRLPITVDIGLPTPNPARVYTC